MINSTAGSTLNTLPAGDAAPAPARPTAFSYCVECGSWDAHLHKCETCGFDFRMAERTRTAGELPSL